MFRLIENSLIEIQVQIQHDSKRILNLDIQTGSKLFTNTDPEKTDPDSDPFL